MLTKAFSVVLLWLLCASAAEGAHAPRHLPVRKLCDGHSTTLLKLLRYPKSLSGPSVKSHRARAWLVFDLAAAHLQRSRGPNPVGDDDEAIQNDTAATGSYRDESCAPGLRPLGIVNAALAGRPLTRAFSPRSPRGPPVSV